MKADMDRQRAEMDRERERGAVLAERAERMRGSLSGESAAVSV